MTQYSFFIVLINQSTLEILAPNGNAKTVSTSTNVSRSVSFSVLNFTGEEMPVPVTNDQLIEIRIPRDPNLIIIIMPAMTLENVTASNDHPHRLLFYLHHVTIADSSSSALHIEMSPLDANLAHLFIYRLFDQVPIMNSSLTQIDGWSLCCPSSLDSSSCLQVV
jgi:hypothetical protein